MGLHQAKYGCAGKHRHTKVRTALKEEDLSAYWLRATLRPSCVPAAGRSGTSSAARTNEQTPPPMRLQEPRTDERSTGWPNLESLASFPFAADLHTLGNTIGIP